MIFSYHYKNIYCQHITMAFAFMDIQKIKTEGQMTAKYNHNCRKIEIDNVIPELSHLNEDLIPLPVDQNGNELSYYDAFKKRINELPYYQDHNIRKNAVRGYEVLLTFSKDESINVDEWKKLSVKWLKDTFNVAPDERNNVLHVAFHADETGNYHCHAFVVPIDEKGKLNACRFTDGSRALSDLQTSYSNAVKGLGLKRGLAGSSAKHKDIRRMYANLNNAMNVPEVKEGETALQYRSRVMDDLKTSYAASLKDIDDRATKKMREADEHILKQKETMEKELELTHSTANKNLEKLFAQEKEIQKNVDDYENMLAELSKQMYEMKIEISEVEKNKKKIKKYDEFQKGMNILQSENPDQAKTMRNNIDYVMKKAKEIEKNEEIRKNI